MGTIVLIEGKEKLDEIGGRALRELGGNGRVEGRCRVSIIGWTLLSLDYYKFLNLKT